MPPARRSYDTTTRGALQEAELQEIGLHHSFEGGGVFTERSRQGVETNRPTAMTLEQELQKTAITGVKTPTIHPVQAEGFIHERSVDHSRRQRISGGRATHAGHIPHPPQQTIGNARGAPATPSDFSAALG